MTDYTAQADVLDDAADLIERNGWWNYRLNIRPEGDPVCALNAICRSMSRLEVRIAACRSLELFVGCEGIVPDWNDLHDNPQPVLDGLRSCAKELRILAECD